MDVLQVRAIHQSKQFTVTYHEIMISSPHAVDVLSGKRLEWDTPSVVFECMEGLNVTAVKESDLDRAWMGWCPPSGSMWKKIRRML